MSKKTNIEEQIVNFFQSGDDSKVETLFNVIKGVMKNRAAKPAVVKTSSRKPRTSAAPAEAPVAEAVQDQAA